MNKVKISVIIPVYNSEKYLNKCIKSVLNQSLNEIEIIIINDYSTDDSLKIIEKIKKIDKRVVLIDNSIKSGVSSARNQGLKIAKGKYILFIDSDDWIEPDYLFSIYEKANSDNLDIVISNLIMDYYYTSEILEDLKISDDEVIEGYKYIKIFFEKNQYGYLVNKLIKRDIFYKNNIFLDEDISFMEDFEFIGRVSFYSKKIGKINKAFYHYMQNSQSSSRKLDINRLKSMIKVYDNLLIFYKNDIELSEIIKKVRNLTLTAIVFNRKYVNFLGYEEILSTFIYNLKKEKYILELKKGRIYYTYKRIIIFNLLKFMSNICPNIIIKILS